MKSDEAIKLFGLNNVLIETEICRVERENHLDLGHHSFQNGYETKQTKWHTTIRYFIASKLQFVS
jgi:hypothetical protein